MASARHWGATTGAFFAAADYHRHPDPVDRVLAYLDLRASLIGDDPAAYSCVAGTMAQEAFARSPAVRDACGTMIDDHVLTLQPDFQAAIDRYAPGSGLSAHGIATFAMVVIQGAFVVSKAVDDPRSCSMPSSTCAAMSGASSPTTRSNAMTDPTFKTCLWFDADGLEAAELYCSLIEDAEITHISSYTDANTYGETGRPLEVDFRLGSQQFVALNGGPQFPHTEAASIQVYVEGQAELDRLWDGLLAGGGEPSMCGWLRDRFGLSWQVIPTRLAELMNHPDAAASERVVACMLTMQKLDIAELEAAAEA